VKLDVADFVSDEGSTLSFVAHIFATNGAALLIEEGSRSLEHRVTFWKPGEINVEELGGGFDQLERP